MSIKTVSDSAEAKNSVQHRIRSFVLRQGRMTAAQESGLELLPQKGLFREHGLLDCEKAFGRSAPTVLEIGFGMGASLLQMAQAAPDKNFIGIEVHRPGVGKLLHDMTDAGVDNIRVYSDDAVEVLQHCIADDSLDAVQIFFPDPWHKKRHHKRRLVQPEFVELIHRKLKTSGVLHAATDWQDYAEHILAVMQAAPNFRNCAINDYAPRPDYRPKTKFEQRGERLGHGVWDIMFAKI